MAKIKGEFGMKTKTLQVVFVILLILVMISVFTAGTMLTLPLLKRTEVDIAKEQGDKMQRSYASSDVAGNSNAKANSLSREYEIKDEETWDVSENGDGSVIAKWTLENRTLTISGTGEIKDYKFSGKQDYHNSQYIDIITNVIIGKEITKIGDYAFEGCSSLESIEIPSSVTSIGNGAFIECRSLESISIERNNQKYLSENGVLFNRDKTELIKYPSNKKDIIKYTIPSSVMSICDEAFYSCGSLTTIEIPDAVTNIGKYAFWECNKLEKIEIPNGLADIKSGMFGGCEHLTSIELPSGVTSIGDFAFEGCSRIESINIPSSVTSIGSSAFNECSRLASINIPSSVTRIGYYAFSGCSSLASINIPSSVTNIEEEAISSNTIIYTKADSEGHRYAESVQQGYILDGTPSKISTNYEIKDEEMWDVSENQDGSVLAKWTLENATLTITGTGGMKNFYIEDKSAWHNSCNYASLIKNVVIEEGITDIGSEAFYGCSRLEKIEIPSSVTSIGINTFRKCKSLGKIEIPSSVTSIGKYAFLECSNLTNINVEGNSENYLSEDGILFNKDKTELIQVPANKNIFEYEIPRSVTSIGNDAFYGCRTLEKIEILNNVTSIGWFAFSGCDRLKNINIPESIDSIEWGTFQECISLERLEIPSSVKSIESSAFEGCSSLTSINIPSSVKSIESSAFEGCSSLTSVNIPSSVTSIGKGAFNECSSLESIEIPSRVTSIEERVFYGCSSLKSINIPSSITSIGEMAFSRCSSLESIQIPDTVVEIGSSAIPSNTIIYTKANSEGHRYAEEGKQGYILEDSPDTSKPIFTLNEYKIKDKYIVKIKPNTTYTEFKKDISTNMTYSIKEGTKTISETDIIKTGQVLTTEAGEEYTLVVIGDLNGDGKISLVELARISKIGAGKVNDIKEIEKMAIDVNVDGNITILDLASIAKLQNN